MSLGFPVNNKIYDADENYSWLDEAFNSPEQSEFQSNKKNKETLSDVITNKRKLNVDNENENYFEIIKPTKKINIKPINPSNQLSEDKVNTIKDEIFPKSEKKIPDFDLNFNMPLTANWLEDIAVNKKQFYNPPMTPAKKSNAKFSEFAKMVLAISMQNEFELHKGNEIIKFKVKKSNYKSGNYFEALDIDGRCKQLVKGYKN